MSNYFAKQYCFTRKCLFSGKVGFFDQKYQSARRSNGSIFFKFWQNERFFIKTWFLCFTLTVSFLDFEYRLVDQRSKKKWTKVIKTMYFLEKRWAFGNLPWAFFGEKVYFLKKKCVFWSIYEVLLQFSVRY